MAKIVGTFLDDELWGTQGSDQMYGELDLLGIMFPVNPSLNGVFDNVDIHEPWIPSGFTLTFGNDSMYGGNGNDSMYGDVKTFTGIFSLDVSAINGALVDLKVDDLNFSVSGGNDSLFGENGDDLLVGDANFGHHDSINISADTDSYVNATDINESIILTTGDDILDGGNGNDIIIGDFLDPTFSFNNSVRAIGENAYAEYSHQILNCAIIFGDDTIYGGSGNDIIYGEGEVFYEVVVGADAIADGAGAIALGDALTSNYLCDFGDDFIDAGSGNDIIFGDVKSCNLEAYAGTALSLNGGVASADASQIGRLTNCGDDTILAGKGDDMVVADALNYTLVAESSETAEAIIRDNICLEGDDIVDAGMGNDTVIVDILSLTLLDSDYSITDVDNRVTLSDSYGNLVIYGNDEIILGGGNDTIIYSLNSDMDSGDMAFQGHDLILDFNMWEDNIVLGQVEDLNDDGVVNLDDVMLTSSVDNQGDQTVIKFDAGGSLTLAGVSINSLIDLSIDVYAGDSHVPTII